MNRQPNHQTTRQPIPQPTTQTLFGLQLQQPAATYPATQPAAATHPAEPLQFLRHLRARGINPVIANGRLALKSSTSQPIDPKIKMVAAKNQSNIIAELLEDDETSYQQRVAVRLLANGYCLLFCPSLDNSTIIITRNESTPMPLQHRDKVRFTIREIQLLIANGAKAEEVRELWEVKREFVGAEVVEVKTDMVERTLRGEEEG